MERDITAYIRTCPSCQRVKRRAGPAVGLLRSLPIPDRRWHTIGMDFAAMPRTSLWGGKDHGVDYFDSVLVIVDYLSSRGLLFPCRQTITTKELAHLFMQAFRHTGAPRVIVSDRDPRYLSDFWTAFTTLLGTTLELSTARHQQTDGKVERLIGTLKRVMPHYLDYVGSNWVDLLPMLEFTYNATPNHTGYAPFQVDLGRIPRTLNEFMIDKDMNIRALDAREVAALSRDFKDVERIVQQRLRDLQDKQAVQYDRHRGTSTFGKGDRVLLSTDGIDVPALRKLPAKLRQRWIGPFEILELGPHPDTYRLKLPYQFASVYPVFHVGILRQWHPPSSSHYRRQEEAPDPVVVDNEDEYVVERILDAKLRHGKPFYLVKWLGYPLEESTWEPATNLIGNQAYEDWITAYGELTPKRAREEEPQPTTRRVRRR